LHARLAALDPVAAARMEPTNARRVVRALEVCEGSGRPFSSFGPGLDVYPSTDVVQLALQWTRPALAARVERRVHQMMADGLLAEVERLAAAAGGLSRTARQALGYKELLEHLDGRWSLDRAVEAVVLRTRQFAVRQERWFRRDPRLRWVPVHHDPLEALPVLIESLTT
jgi:tRNA dimethylallyltransferase